jgi:hypothetical protein
VTFAQIEERGLEAWLAGGGAFVLREWLGRLDQRLVTLKN